MECDPKFRLYLHSTVEPHIVPQSLAAYSSVMYFQLYRSCVEEELLNRFMAQEKSRLEDEQTALRQVQTILFQHLQYRCPIILNIRDKFISPPSKTK